MDDRLYDGMTADEIVEIAEIISEADDEEYFEEEDDIEE